MRSLMSFANWNRGDLIELIQRIERIAANLTSRCSPVVATPLVAGLGDEMALARLSAKCREWVASQPPLNVRLVAGPPFAPRRRGAAPKTANWRAIARAVSLDPIPNVATLNVGTPLADPLAALALLSPDVARAQSVAVAWTTSDPLSAAVAPVAPIHSLLDALVVVAPSQLIVAHPEGFELDATWLSGIERRCLQHGIEFVIRRQTPPKLGAGSLAEWVVAQPWSALSWYDHKDQGLAAVEAAIQAGWGALQPTTPRSDLAVFQATLAYLSQPS